MTDPVWLEPPDPQAGYELRESVELAFVTALQHLPATQRAVLILREVLAFSAAEVADQLGTTVASVNSALRRARATLGRRGLSQQATPRELGEQRARGLVEALVEAWERADVSALLDLLTEDARFTMPPLPTWFAGRAGIERFLIERMFETEWRMVPARANAQLTLACHQGPQFRLGALTVLTARRPRRRDDRVPPGVHELMNIPRNFSTREKAMTKASDELNAACRSTRSTCSTRRRASAAWPTCSTGAAS